MRETVSDRFLTDAKKYNCSGWYIDTTVRYGRQARRTRLGVGARRASVGGHQTESVKTATKMSEIRLPKWEPVQVNVSTENVDREKIEEVAEKTEDGYFVVEGDDPYLLVSRKGAVCEVGRLKTEGGRRNVGQAFERVTMGDVEESLEEGGGSVSFYSLPERVCADLCSVINGHARYGDLNTDILELDELLGRLSEDGFTGAVVFTSDDEYAFVDYEDGEAAEFRYEGDADVDEPEELAEGTLGRMEANIFEPRTTGTGGETVDYDGIAGALGDACARVWGRDRFEEALEENLRIVDGAAFEGGEVVADDPDEEKVFEAYRKAVEATVGETPAAEVFEEVPDSE